jgi:hypothetical protein
MAPNPALQATRYLADSRLERIKFFFRMSKNEKINFTISE